MHLLCHILQEISRHSKLFLRKGFKIFSRVGFIVLLKFQGIRNFWCRNLSSYLSMLQKIRVLFYEIASTFNKLNTENSFNFLVWTFVETQQFLQNFERFARNSAETVRFYKMSTPGSPVKFLYFMQWYVKRTYFFLSCS